MVIQNGVQKSSIDGHRTNALLRFADARWNAGIHFRSMSLLNGDF